MRLIDESDVFRVLTEYYHHKTKEQSESLTEALSRVPTVEAIPLNWILTWWAHQGMPSLSHCIYNTNEVIRTMLMDWEKENETD